MEDKKEEHVRPSERGSVAFLSRHRQAPAGEVLAISIAPISPHVKPRTWRETQYDENGRSFMADIPVVSLEDIDSVRYAQRSEAYHLER